MGPPAEQGMQVPYRTHPLRFWLIVIALSLSFVLGYFALHTYRSAIPAAEENLRGLALSLAATIESLAGQDASLAILNSIQSPDIAFFAVIDPSGHQRYHTNAALIGAPVSDSHYRAVLATQRYQEARITLGTGEEAYEFTAPFHLAAQTFAVRLVLHTYRADSLVRRAEIGALSLVGLTIVGWVLGVILYHYARRAERHRREMAEREHLAQLGTLGAVLAHEVRNPLAGIKGYAQLLVEQLPKGDKRDFADLIVTEALRLEGLVHDLLTYVRNDAPRLAAVDLSDLIGHTLDLVRREATNDGIGIESRFTGHMNMTTDPDRLKQVLLNLVKNAIQAMNGGGMLSVSAERCGNEMVVTVADTGQGISPDDRERIFEPFFTRRARGSGIGLAISKKYLAELGGRVMVQSEPGKGSIFQIIMPVSGREQGA